MKAIFIRIANTVCRHAHLMPSLGIPRDALATRRWSCHQPSLPRVGDTHPHEHSDMVTPLQGTPPQKTNKPQYLEQHHDLCHCTPWPLVLNSPEVSYCPHGPCPALNPGHFCLLSHTQRPLAREYLPHTLHLQSLPPCIPDRSSHNMFDLGKAHSGHAHNQMATSPSTSMPHFTFNLSDLALLADLHTKCSTLAKHTLVMPTTTKRPPALPLVGHTSPSITPTLNCWQIFTQYVQPWQSTLRSH